MLWLGLGSEIRVGELGFRLKEVRGGGGERNGGGVERRGW